jgi:hypothetical protein
VNITRVDVDDEGENELAVNLRFDDDGEDVDVDGDDGSENERRVNNDTDASPTSTNDSSSSLKSVGSIVGFTLIGVVLIAVPAVALVVARRARRARQGQHTDEVDGGGADDNKVATMWTRAQQTPPLPPSPQAPPPPHTATTIERRQKMGQLTLLDADGCVIDSSVQQPGQHHIFYEAPDPNQPTLYDSAKLKGFVPSGKLYGILGDDHQRYAVPGVVSGTVLEENEEGLSGWDWQDRPKQQGSNNAGGVGIGSSTAGGLKRAPTRAPQSSEQQQALPLVHNPVFTHSHSQRDATGKPDDTETLSGRTRTQTTLEDHNNMQDATPHKAPYYSVAASGGAQTDGVSDVSYYGIAASGGTQLDGSGEGQAGISLAPDTYC